MALSSTRSTESRPSAERGCDSTGWEVSEMLLDCVDRSLSTTGGEDNVGPSV